MNKIGRVTHTGVVQKIPYGTREALIVQARFSNRGVQSVICPPGINGDTSPQVGDILYCIDFGGLVVAVAAESGDGAVNPGERVIYSRNPDGNKIARITMLNSGEVDIEALKMPEYGEDEPPPSADPVAKISLLPDGSITAATIKDGENVAQIIMDSDGKIALTNADGMAIKMDSSSVTINGNLEVLK